MVEKNEWVKLGMMLKFEFEINHQKKNRNKKIPVQKDYTLISL